MPKVLVNGVEQDHSGNLIKALQDHPEVQELNAEAKQRLNEYGNRLKSVLSAGGSSAMVASESGFTLTGMTESKYNNVFFNFSGTTGSVLNTGKDFHNVIHTDYGVWQHALDGEWLIVYSDGNWFRAGTTTVDPAEWEHRGNPAITDIEPLHWWGNGAHTVDNVSEKFGPVTSGDKVVTWS